MRHSVSSHMCDDRRGAHARRRQAACGPDWSRTCATPPRDCAVRHHPYIARMTEDTLQRAVAEMVGAFTLTFIGAGAAAASGVISDPSLIGVAIANGLAIGVMVCALGHISGGHFNPAVTFGFLITRKIKPGLAGVYWVAQFGGAALAALLVKQLLPRAATEAIQTWRARARPRREHRPDSRRDARSSCSRNDERHAGQRRARRNVGPQHRAKANGIRGRSPRRHRWRSRAPDRPTP